MRLGIDFGTTRTVVAAADDGRYPVASFDCESGYRDYLPAMAAWRDGALIFGEAAARVAGAGEGTAVASIKRAVSAVAPDDPIPELGGVTALELVTAYLRWVHAMVAEHSNFEVGMGETLSVMVAAPANASTRQRFLTLEAFERAGFEVVGLVNEPTSAAIEFAHRHTNVLSPRSPKRYVVVYDLGGGTFDTAAVSLQERRFDLLSARGVSKLGGADFDRAILHLAAGQAGLDVDALPSSTRVALLEVCREAKETLRPSSRKLMIDLASVVDAYGTVVLESGDIFEACQPLIDRTIDMVVDLFDALAARGIDTDDARQLGALYLVGGSAAFPTLGRTLRQRFGRKIQLAPLPHAATAIGLAIAADPGAAIFVREALTRHFGVWREADNGRDKVFDPILTKDTAPPEHAPTVVQRHYRAAHAIGHLRFLECSDLDDHGQPAGDLTPWDDVRFPYDPSLADESRLDVLPVARHDGLRSDDIVETYTHAPDGTIAVQIENRTQGYRRTYLLGASPKASPKPSPAARS